MKLGRVYVVRTTLSRPPKEKLTVCISSDEALFFWINTDPRSHGVGQLALAATDCLCLSHCKEGVKAPSVDSKLRENINDYGSNRGFSSVDRHLFPSGCAPQHTAKSFPRKPHRRLSHAPARHPVADRVFFRFLVIASINEITLGPVALGLSSATADAESGLRSYRARAFRYASFLSAAIRAILV
jgi:hypothetical protein